MDNVTENGASDMNTIKNKDRTSAMTPQDCEELKSSTVTREIAFATKPLSKEETRDAFHEMIAAAMRGDDARRNKIRAKVFRSMILLVLKITCKTVEWHRDKYPDASISVLDYLHEGYSALYSAIDSFNPDKGTCLSTYAHRAIINRLNEFAFIRKRMDGRILEIKSLEETYGKDWATKIGDIIADNGEPVDSVVASKEAVTALWHGISQLSKRERDCLCARFELVKDCSKQADVAAKYGITPARACQITRGAIEKLRAYLAA